MLPFFYLFSYTHTTLVNQKYGYFLKEPYSTAELRVAKTNPSLLLRGPDLLFHSSAKSLGLNPKLQVVFRNMYGDNAQDWGDPEEICESLRHIFDLLLSKDIPEENFLPAARLCSAFCGDPDNYLLNNFGAQKIEEGEVIWLSSVPNIFENMATVADDDDLPPKGLYYIPVLILCR